MCITQTAASVWSHTHKVHSPGALSSPWSTVIKAHSDREIIFFSQVKDHERERLPDSESEKDWRGENEIDVEIKRTGRKSWTSGQKLFWKAWASTIQEAWRSSILLSLHFLHQSVLTSLFSVMPPHPTVNCCRRLEYFALSHPAVN